MHNDKTTSPSLSAAKQKLLAELLAGRRIAPRASVMGVRPEGAPLGPSILQEANWAYGAKVDTDRSLYDCLPVRNLSTSVRIIGPLDVDAIRLSFGDILARHDVLHTSYSFQDGRVTAIVRPPELDFEFRNLSASAEAGLSLALSLAREDEARDFDLTTGSLIRFRLYQIAEADFVLFVVVDHIAFDGWSFGVFVGELNQIYNARTAGRAVYLAPLPLQYGDFAHWSRRTLEIGGLEGARQYWRDHLREIPRVLLPTFSERQTPQPYRQGHHPVSLPADLSAQIIRFSRTHGLTPFSLLLAAFKLLLWRITSLTKLTVLCPVANRTDTSLHGLIGKFANSAAIQTDLDPEGSFLDFARSVRDAAGRGVAHQAVPFSLLAQELFPDSHPFHVSFCLQNYPMPKLDLSALKITDLRTNFGTTVRDFAVVLVDGPEAYAGYVTYNAILFDPKLIAKFFTAFGLLIARCVNSPETINRDLAAQTAVAALTHP